MKPHKILFVCLGNICRSPSAEAVFRSYVEEQGHADRFHIDSAGLSNYHQGEKADARMRAHAARRGYELTSLSRPVEYEDFERFDYIIGMDFANRERLQELAPTEEAAAKIRLMTDFSSSGIHDHVPDPYYGGASGFELVLDILEECTSGLFSYLTEPHDNSSQSACD